MTVGELAEIITLDILRFVVLVLVAFMGVIGFLICAPFPSFWKELKIDSEDLYHGES